MVNFVYKKYGTLVNAFDDHNGLMYYLGTSEHTRPWENPMDLGYVEVISAAICGRGSC